MLHNFYTWFLLFILFLFLDIAVFILDVQNVRNSSIVFTGIVWCITTLKQTKPSFDIEFDDIKHADGKSMSKTY